MSSKKKPQSLVEKAKAIAKQRRHTWLDDLTPELRAELEELRRAWLSNELPSHVTAMAVYHEIAVPAGITITRVHFDRWFNDR